jgi:hypothetical protein
MKWKQLGGAKLGFVEKREKSLWEDEEGYFG